ncbi:hypothetical protein ANO11243_045640 [Dothideomycetidae sp. 11243]|nr:hypothetical protein ANO11243_045640 [fungal sp. No.11243]
MSLWKNTRFSLHTPLPPHISRAAAVQLLHKHEELLRLNPLIVDIKRSQRPDRAPEDESHYTWYELTDHITYFPGLSYDVPYHGGFLDTPDGLKTHVYAPAGLEIRERWSIARADDESGLADGQSLVLIEDVDMSCNIFLTYFVRKNIEASHATLTRRLLRQDAPNPSR